MLTRKMWNHVINLKEKFISRKKKIYLFLRKKERSKRVYLGVDKKGIYSTIKITTNSTSVLCKKEGWEKEDSTRLSVSE